MTSGLGGLAPFFRRFLPLLNGYTPFFYPYFGHFWPPVNGFYRLQVGGIAPISPKLDYCSIEEARLGLGKLMDTYVRNEIALRKDIPANDFFIPVTKQEQRHPFFDKLLDKEVFLLQQNQLLRNCLSTVRIETVILLINFNLKMALMLEYGSCTYGAISEKRISISVMIMMHQTS